MVQKVTLLALVLLAYLVAAAVDYLSTYLRQAKLPPTAHSSAELSEPMRQLVHQHRLSGADLSQLITDMEQQKKRYLE